MGKANKQVWLLNHYAQEPGHAGGTRHFSIAKYLSRYGWDASIVAASVELNTGRQRLKDGVNTDLKSFDGVSFLWLRTPTYEGNGGGRFWNMLVYSMRAWLPSSTRALPRPDVIVGSSVHPFAALAAQRLAQRMGVSFVFEVRDLWPQTLVDLGRVTDKQLITKLLRRLERYLYRKADRIAVLLPQAHEYIEPLGIASEKITYIPNGVDLGAAPEPAPAVPGDAFTLMYFGAHGTANGLETVLRAMKIVESRADLKHVRLRLIGNGPMKPSLMALADDIGLKHVQFEDAVPKNAIPALAAEADAFVFNLVDAPVFNYGISSNKLFDFMAAARPILFCCNASNNPVAESGAGVTVPPGQPAALACAISDITQLDPEQRAVLGKAGRDYVAGKHDFTVLAKSFAQLLDEVVR